MKKKMTKAGFSLVEIMVALGISGIVSMGVLQISKMMNQNSTKFNVDSDTTLITNEIVAILSNPTNCLATFSLKNAVNTAAGIVNSILLNTQPRYVTNAATGNSGVKINSYSLSDADSDVDVATNTTNLIIHFARKKAQTGTGDIIKKVKLYVEVNASKQITSCRSLSSSNSDIWSRGNAGDIYYSGGNVGIGTSAPTASLTVDGNALFGTTTAVATTAPLLVSLGGTYGTNTAGSSGNLKWRVYDDGVSANAYGIGMSASLMEFRSGAGAGIGLFTNNGSPVMRLTSGGNVGIGTTTPLQKLDVNGSIKLAYGKTLYFGADDSANPLIQTARSDGSQLGYLYSDGWKNFAFSNGLSVNGLTSLHGSSAALYVNGNVGIGTPNPLSKLQVEGGVRAKKGDALFSDASQVGFSYEGDGDTGMFAVGGNPNFGSTLILKTDGVTALSTKGGNVGIGTIAPQAKLDVQGEIKVGMTGANCTASNGGQLRFNSTSKKMEFCNGTSWAAIYSIPDVYIVKKNSVLEGTPVCCTGANDIILSGNWSSYVGEKGTYTTRDASNHCMKLYEGTIHDGVGNVELVCASID